MFVKFLRRETVIKFYFVFLYRTNQLIRSILIIMTKNFSQEIRIEELVNL